MTVESTPASINVFRGSKALCREYSLMFEAKGIEHELQEHDGSWVLTVPAHLLQPAYEEISRYSAERNIPRSTQRVVEPYSGAALGAICYATILILTAYCAGRRLFDLDWLSAGDLEAGLAREWWRALTALTLHIDQEHLMGNLLFGTVVGIAAARLLGPGVAWLSILAAGAIANYVEILISPTAHRALGASTAVFAALGLLAGMAWREGISSRERAWYRWAPLLAGICLLTLLGAGNEHVDVLGHGLGFLFGLGFGWIHARVAAARNRDVRVQLYSGIGAGLLLCVAWLLALTHAT